MADWRDFTIVICTALIILGAISLSFTAQSFSIVKGKVVEKGVGLLEADGRPTVTNTVSVLIASDDRVFDIKRGTIVTYPVTENDIRQIEIGSEVELFITSHNSVARLLSHHSPRTT